MNYYSSEFEFVEDETIQARLLRLNELLTTIKPDVMKADGLQIVCKTPKLYETLMSFNDDDADNRDDQYAQMKQSVRNVVINLSPCESDCPNCQGC